MLRIDSEGVITAIDNFKVFKKQAKEVADESTKTEKSVTTLDNAFSALSPSALTAVAGITALIGTINKLTNVGSRIIEVSSHFEQTQKSLESLLQSADKGKALFEDLRKFSFDTTFGVDELASASSQLINSGVAVKDLREQLKMLGDVAQGDKARFAELTSVFAKVQLLGKAGAQTISQFNIRGVPLRKTLTEMGVTGTASAEQVTEALKKLTAEGGQFHDAMNNIIDTIEGKRGFIDDTLKEINVNFGKLSGLTDTYKVALDKVYDVLDKVNNKLMEWNQNPMMQALIRGIIVGAITAIGLAITTTVIPALIKTIAQLKIIQALKASINPTGLLVGLGISAVAGLAVAVSTLAKSEKEVNNELVDQIRYREKLGQISADSTVEEKQSLLSQMEEQLKTYKELQATTSKKYTEGIYDAYFDDIKLYERLVKEQQGIVDRLTEQGVVRGTIEKVLTASGKVETRDNRTPLQKELDEAYRNVERFQKKLAELRKNEDINIYYRDLQKNIESLQVMIEYQQKLEKNQKKLEEFSPYAKQLATLKELQTQLETINGMYEEKGKKFLGVDENGVNQYAIDLLVNLDPSYKTQVDEAKKYITKQISEIKVQLSLSQARDFEKSLQKVLGFDDKTSASLLWHEGGDWIKKYVEEYEKRVNRKTQTDALMGYNQLETETDRILAQAKDMMQIYEKLMSAEGAFGINDKGELDKTTTEINKVMSRLKESFLALNGTEEAWGEMLKNIKNQTETAVEEIEEVLEEEYKSLAVILAENTQKALDEYFEWNGAKNKAKSYLGAYAKETAYGAISSTDVGTFLESFTKTGSVVLSILEVLIKDIIDVCGGYEKMQYLLNIVKNVLQALSPLLEAIMNLVAILSVVLKPVLDAINNFLKKLFKDWNDWFDEQYKKNEEQKESQTDLTKSYEALLKAIREQEEYYIRKKSELNMLGLADKVTKVNDMILSPNGAFSTSPQDTIIATKNPQNIGGVVNNIKIINNAGVGVNVTENKVNGMNEILVTISKQIASDVANGYNGWDGAFAMQQQRINGRRI